MRRVSGDRAPFVRLPAIDGAAFDLSQLAGRPYLLSFYRFASCPFCNLRIHRLVQRYGELPGNFEIVAIFDSTVENLVRHAERHAPPFPILADAEGKAYEAYRIERSLLGVAKGMILRMPTMLDAMFRRGYWPFRVKGRMTTMPADFLIDPTGIISVAHYGRDEGDHLAFEDIARFANGFKEPARA